MFFTPLNIITPLRQIALITEEMKMKLRWTDVNPSVFLVPLISSCVTALSSHQHQQQHPEVRDTDGEDNGAVVYIIAVLAFYSIGVIVMIIHYLRTDNKEFEEEVIQENTVLKGPRKDHPLNLVGKQVFDTVTSIDCEDFDENESPRTVIVSDL